MTDSMKTLEREQTRRQVNEAVAAARLRVPRQGWIRTVRTALGMSGAALSRRVGGGRTWAANMQRYEREERATLRSMREAAAALGCRFVYAIVPPDGEAVEDLIEAQAGRRARQIVRDASVHMALEAQQLGAADTAAEIERLKKQLLAEMPRDFWDPADGDE
ncbi:mobile mystery protein A [Spectribacter hydrogenoxidans]|uniref:Mobile mystery protein A n=1 Tax=Spectribacter hydrogenoxidans TaxID=3075608 RepID=A0ABU3C0G1_9GAMM|nr:mobile mystery protein A [Salinisphaera sp. W335]MDT0634849.1 mobile mystery protein A [Salinisphaera sp. W335]